MLLTKLYCERALPIFNYQTRRTLLSLVTYVRTSKWWNLLVTLKKIKKCSWIVFQLCSSRNYRELFFNYVPQEMFMNCSSTMFLKKCSWMPQEMFFNFVLQECSWIVLQLCFSRNVHELFFNYVPQEMFMNCSSTMYLKKCSWIVLQLCNSRNVYELFFNHVIIHRSWIVCEQQIVTQELIEHSINCKTWNFSWIVSKKKITWRRCPFKLYLISAIKQCYLNKSLQRLTWQRTIMYKHSMSCDYWQKVCIVKVIQVYIKHVTHLMPGLAR